MVSGKCVLALGLGLGLWGLVQAQNHALRSDHVVVNTQRHWSNWAFVEGTLDIVAGGGIAPAFVPKDHNAVTDIVQHLQRMADNATIPRRDRSRDQQGGSRQPLRRRRNDLLGAGPRQPIAGTGGSKSIWAG